MGKTSDMKRASRILRWIMTIALIGATSIVVARDPADAARNSTTAASSVEKPNDAATPPAGRKPGDKEYESYNVILLLDQGPIHAHFGIALQGRPVEEQRAEHIAELIKGLDKNGDKQLTRDEANASTIFRKTARKGTETFLRKMNLNSKQVVSERDLDMMVRKVAGQPVVFRQNDDAYENDEYIFGLLDDDSSGILDESEIATAAQRLTSLDLDEDECIGFDEVQPPPVQTVDPQLVALGLANEPADVSHSMFSDLMRRTSERSLPNKLIGKYDLNGNGKLSPKELRWEADRLMPIDENKDGELSRSEMKNLDQTPIDVDLTVDVSPIDKSEPAMNVRHCRGEKLPNRHRPGIVHFVMHDSTVTISYRHSDPVDESLDNARRKFNSLDSDFNGYLDKPEIVGETLLERGLFDRMDVDRDEKLFGEEMDAYVRERATVKSMACRVNIFDTGSGFFQTMDHNNDGRISVREMRFSEKSLNSMATDGQPGITQAEPNRRYSIEFSRGSFRLFGSNEQVDKDSISFNTDGNVGPAWFSGSDRNNDGDLSWGEFLGHREDFHYLDLDGDGLIDPIEAARAEDLRER